ncbi:response regulator transcription factor [Actinocorallia sp. API 0066]|uniref:response regulator n=1 Tax=Actinocorallia sp. API 0066 TaxID=2896846 RepID=UPI001E578C2E|nr:response regulator transcription factor [Actinocorallia sp. API 0066]MCD0448964.1 response regulator transcription factor [Actinocorallia sp. API 0066]
MIRVVIADDQVMIRDGLATLLDSDPLISVVGQAGDGAEAIALCGRLDPDVVVMDVRMPGMDGLAATARIASDTGPRVLILTTFDLDEYVYEALGAGASGFLLKDASAQDLIHAVKVVASGDALLAPSVTRRLIQDFARRRRHERPRTDAADGLTPRELDVLRLISRGMSNAEIATELFLAEQTVKTHVGHVLTKLGLRDRTQAVVFAYENGIAG